jgi:hypothetical protein
MNIGKESSGLDNEQIVHEYTGKLCRVLFNFMDNCEETSLWYPIRALAEIFNCEKSELTLSKRLNSRNLHDFKIAKFTKKD